jgi:hypothetical protein
MVLVIKLKNNIATNPSIIEYLRGCKLQLRKQLLGLTS